MLFRSFISDYLEYATDVYEVHHSYFLLKSQLSDRIHKAISRVQEENSHHPQLFFRNNAHWHTEYLSSIHYLERKTRKTQVICDSGSYESTEHAEVILGRADTSCFCRCHHSFWVNLNRVASYKTGCFLLDNGSLVPVSRNYKKDAKEKFLAFLRSDIHRIHQSISTRSISSDTVDDGQAVMPQQ